MRRTVAEEVHQFMCIPVKVWTRVHSRGYKLCSWCLLTLLNGEKIYKWVMVKWMTGEIIGHQGVRIDLVGLEAHGHFKVGL